MEGNDNRLLQVEETIHEIEIREQEHKKLRNREKNRNHRNEIMIRELCAQ